MNFLGLKAGRYILYECSASASLLNRELSPNVRRVSDLSDPGLAPLGIDHDNARRLLESGAVMFVYFEEGVPLGMLWGVAGACHVRGVGVSLLHGPDTVYSFWAYVLPSARGRKIYKALRSSLFSHFRSSKRFTSLVRPGNTVVRAQKEKDGYVKAKIYLYLKCRSASLVCEYSFKTFKTGLRLDLGNKNNLLDI